MSAKLWNTGVRTGGKVLLRLGDQVVAFAQSARFRDDYGLEAVQIIGQLQAIEYVPTHARHEITITMLVVRNTSLVKLGLEPGSAGSFGMMESAKTQIGSGFVEASPARVGSPNVDGSGAGTWNVTYSNGGAADVAVDENYGSTTWYRVLHQKVFDIEVVDMEFLEATDAAPVDPMKVFTGRVLLKYLNCFFAGGEVSVESNRVLMHTATFYAQDKDGNYGLHSR